ncbi:unnamed protein product [Adineta ricciae]|uniref:Glycoside hydrolase family 19 catalytic domain-containing protein n=1 Tax=Adineta ricciae TaxID=249248 RepID=A0A814RGB5_ADIRI|nr:unnamed protein product [Adineta ricciae]
MKSNVLLAFLLLIIKLNNASPITNEQLRAIMPRCAHPEYLEYINSAMTEGQINTCARQAAFLAQVAHESGELVYMEELASGEKYESRRDLGNTQPGDGKKYKGRGPLQLTGRANYRAAGLALGLNLEEDPEQVATPSVGFRTSVWFWTTHKLNYLADQNTLPAFRKITKRINGGKNGQADREKYWKTAKNTLGCAAATTKTTSSPAPTRVPLVTEPQAQSTQSPEITSSSTDVPASESTSMSSSAPIASTPITSTLVVTVSDVSTPAVTLPDVSTPDVTIPDLTTPAVTLPDVSTPDVTIPDLTTPAVTLPDVSTPDVTIPDLTTPVVSTPIASTTLISETTTPIATDEPIASSTFAPETTAPVVTEPSVPTDIPTDSPDPEPSIDDGGDTDGTDNGGDADGTDNDGSKRRRRHIVMISGQRLARDASRNLIH